MAYCMRISYFVAGMLLCSSLVISGAMASSIGSVSGASVNKGELSSELRAGYAVDDDSVSQDNRVRSRIHLDYGLTEFYAPRLIVSGDKRNGDDMAFDSLTFENRFQLLNKQDHGFDAGFRLTYGYKDGDKKPDSVSARIIEVIPYQQWEFRFNQDFAHDIGEDSEAGVEFEWRMQATYKLKDGIRVGLDSFNDFGKLNELSGYSNQSHKVGPIAKGKFDFSGWGYEAGYLAGISAATPDHTFKINFKKSF